jgi:hypothetical protein
MASQHDGIPTSKMTYATLLSMRKDPSEAASVVTLGSLSPSTLVAFPSTIEGILCCPRGHHVVACLCTLLSYCFFLFINAPLPAVEGLIVALSVEVAVVVPVVALTTYHDYFLSDLAAAAAVAASFPLVVVPPVWPHDDPCDVLLVY